MAIGHDVIGSGLAYSVERKTDPLRLNLAEWLELDAGARRTSLLISNHFSTQRGLKARSTSNRGAEFRAT